MPKTVNQEYLRPNSIGVPNAYLLSNPRLQKMGTPLHLITPFDKTQKTLGWGYKKSGLKAREIAKKRNIPYVLAEEGFLSQIKDKEYLQILLDTTGGLHYDPKQPSIIDFYLEQADQDDIREESQTLLNIIKQNNLSKANNRPDTPQHALPDRPFILICDQVENDASLPPSCATPRRFQAMLQTTKQTWPDHLIIIRTHPKANTGHYQNIQMDNVLVLPGTDHPTQWLQHAEHVVVMSSQMGFEALIQGTPVTCWGTPFYAYRGLTRDMGLQPGYQRRQADLIQLIGAALILAPTSFDPRTGDIISALDLARSLAAHRKAINTLPSRLLPGGFSKRKQKHLKRFSPQSTFSPEGTPIGWGLHPGTIRVEDGFIRSKGLGAAFAAPLSWTFDTMGGIHYDHTKPSLCETLLNTTPLTPYLKERGQHIRQRLITENVTKYNLTEQKTIPEKPYTLVLGQVEGDASLKNSPIKTNEGLLESVKSQTQDTILYRPHPDVIHTLRPGTITQSGADIIDTTTDLLTLIDNAKSVHVITSQSGLEALVRGKTVHCHGPAFYAGWGLTNDLMSFPNRIRKLDIDSLISILYEILPIYNDPKTGLFLSIDQALDCLQDTPYTPATPWRKFIGAIANKRRLKALPENG